MVPRPAPDLPSLLDLGRAGVGARQPTSPYPTRFHSNWHAVPGWWPRRRRMRGMDQAAICIRRDEGAEMTFFEFGLIPFILRLYLIILSEWSSMLNAGLKMFVRVYLRLGMNQKSRHFLTALNRLIRDFEGAPN